MIHCTGLEGAGLEILNLIVTPRETPDGAVLEIKGDVELFRGGDVLLEVSLDGIAQHYINATIPLASVILDPSLPVVA